MLVIPGSQCVKGYFFLSSTEARWSPRTWTKFLVIYNQSQKKLLSRKRMIWSDFVAESEVPKEIFSS